MSLLHGRNLMGDTGDMSPQLFQTGGHNMPCTPHFFVFRFCIREVSKLKVMSVAFLCEEF